MNLQKLFEIQAGLDEHILENHPELRDQNNSDWKLLALQVELGECANEWRGFKKWSNNQKPRTKVEYLCVYCHENGLVKPNDFSSGMPCEECDGTGKTGETNPLLMEYVDCLHFFLSIGLEMGLSNVELFKFPGAMKEDSITDSFLNVFEAVSGLDVSLTYDEYVFAFSRFFELGEILGFTSDEIEAAYYAKNKINHERQDGGY